MTPDPLLDTLAGNYRLVAKLGAGGMGDVYKAVHATIGSKVAIKVLHATSDPDSEERFLREAQAVNLIEHDGVVKVLDAGRLSSGRPYLVMELLEGAALNELQRANALAPIDACLVMVDVLDALSAAHAASVVHRDLKPANIFRTRSGRTVVLDFGIAKLLAADGPARLTMSGSAIGTPAYMAPEQIGDQNVGPSADLYAAGVVLYELLCGRLPFDGGTVEILNGHLERRPPPPRALRPELPAAISDLLLRALEKDPNDRFPSAAAMRDALRLAMTGALASAPRPGSAPVITERVSDATVDLARGARLGAPIAPQRPKAGSPTSEHVADQARREAGFAPTEHVTDATREAARAGSASTEHVADMTRREASRAGAAPTEHVPDTRGLPSPTQHVADDTRARANAPARRSRTWIVLVALGVIGAAVAIAVVATKRGGSRATRDASVVVRDESRDGAVLVAPGEDAVLEDAAAVEAADASTVPQRPADEVARDAAMRLPSLRNRRVEPCLAEDQVGRDLAADPLGLAIARYRNLLACKHVLADDALARGLAQVEELRQTGELEVATRLVDRQLASLATLAINRGFVMNRLATVRALQGDNRVTEATRDRMSELLRDASAELAAGRFESANIALDEAAMVAWKSIKLRGG